MPNANDMYGPLFQSGTVLFITFLFGMFMHCSSSPLYLVLKSQGAPFWGGPAILLSLLVACLLVLGSKATVVLGSPKAVVCFACIGYIPGALLADIVVSIFGWYGTGAILLVLLFVGIKHLQSEN